MFYGRTPACQATAFRMPARQVTSHRVVEQSSLSEERGVGRQSRVVENPRGGIGQLSTCAHLSSITASTSLTYWERARMAREMHRDSQRQRAARSMHFSLVRDETGLFQTKGRGSYKHAAREVWFAVIQVVQSTPCVALLGLVISTR